jgi:hypothetical protein
MMIQPLPVLILNAVFVLAAVCVLLYVRFFASDE